MKGLIDKGTFEVVKREESGEGYNILGVRFLPAIKGIETDRPTYKAIFVVQGHPDKDKESLVNTASTLRQH